MYMCVVQCVNVVCASGCVCVALMFYCACAWCLCSRAWYLKLFHLFGEAGLNYLLKLQLLRVTWLLFFHLLGKVLSMLYENTC